MKKFLMLVAAALCVASAQASTLYWQVTEDTGETFQYAQLKATGGDLDSPVVVAMAAAEGSNPSHVVLQSSNLGQYGADGYSFFVEMVNYTDGNFVTVATGATYSYTQLESSGYVANDITTSTSAMAAASSMNMGAAVPEPSSGLLLLLGGAMLVLRRRRRK